MDGAGKMAAGNVAQNKQVKATSESRINSKFYLPSVPGSQLFEDTREWMLKNDPDLQRHKAAHTARFASDNRKQGFGGIKQKVVDMIQAQQDRQKTKQLERRIVDMRKKGEAAKRAKLKVNMR